MSVRLAIELAIDRHTLARALGTWSFDANGDTSLTTMTIQQIVAGKFQPVHEVSAP